MGCDIPDIEAAVVYGVDSFVSFVQKGGRAGRDGKIEAKMVWLVEDWIFEDSSGAGGKRARDRLAKVDPMASKYIHCQQSGTCLRNFMNTVLRPDPRTLDLPGFGGRNTSGLNISWVVESGGIQPGAGKCCSAHSCRILDSDSENDDHAGTKKPSIESRHRLILRVLRHESSTAEEVLGPPPGRHGIRCPRVEKEIFRAVLEQWRIDRWEAIRATAPMLSKAWVLGEHNLRKVTENIRLVVNTPAEKINRLWVRALIDSVAGDETIDELSSTIRRFRSGFFERKQQRAAGSSSQPSQGTSALTQDPHLDLDYSSHKDAHGKRKRTDGLQTTMAVSTLSAWPHFIH